jgi:hypothetical protein
VSIGDEYMPVHGRRVVEQREHAGGHVGELELLTGFLRRTAEAGRTAAEELAGN